MTASLARADPIGGNGERGRSVHDPVTFQTRWLGRRLWEKQREIIRSVETNELTAVKGCHASGKTFVAAGMPLWWLARHTTGKVFTTAPTLRQVKLLWEEVALARRGQAIAQFLPEPTVQGLRIDEGRYGLGASSSRGVNVQGFHGSDVLIIADEAPGIEADIWDAIEGIRAGGRVRVLELGNPVIPSGHFYDSFTRARAIFNCISISAFDTPNLQDESTGLPLTIERLLSMPEEEIDVCAFRSLITRRWVRERYHVWGPNHPKYRSRVLAEFPSQSPYSVFALDWIERAKREPTAEELNVAHGGTIQVGIDVAGAGDDETALCARVNGIIIHQESWNDADPRGAVSRVLGELQHHRRYRLGIVAVDIVGIGYNFALHLADQGFPVLGFQAGARPMEPMLFTNCKAEAYFTAREWFKQGLVSGLTDEECEAQLTTIQYRETSRGLTEIESKEEMRKRGVPSPDRAEALIMAFCRIVPAEQRIEGDHYRVHISPF